MNDIVTLGRSQLKKGGKICTHITSKQDHSLNKDNGAIIHGLFNQFFL